MTLAPRVTPKCEGHRGARHRWPGSRWWDKLFDCLLLALRLASNNFPVKRHSRVSNRLPIGTLVDVPPQTGGNDSAAMQLKHYLQLTDRADKISISSPC